MDAALKLFADCGYKATTIGAIETEAGLAPRSGALYQHFKGKQQLLEAMLDRELAGMDELAHAMEMFPLGDLRAELTMLARWNLASLDRRASLTRFVRREADLLPQRQRAKLYDRLVARPYAEIVAWLGARFREAGVDAPDWIRSRSSSLSRWRHTGNSTGCSVKSQARSTTSGSSKPGWIPPWPWAADTA